MKYGKRLTGLTLALAITTVALPGCRVEDLREAERVETAAPVRTVSVAAPGAAEPARETLRKKYISGNHGFFQPDKTCTRAEIAQILCNLGISAPSGRQFSDVNPAAWYGPAVTQLSGVLQGYDDGTMRPLQEISLAELLTILCRAMDVETPTAAAGQPWYTPVVNEARQRGWLEGLPGFVPSARADRASVVAVCNRAMGRTPNRAAIDRLSGRLFLDLSKNHFAYYDVMEASMDHYTDWRDAEIPPLAPGLHALDGVAYLVKNDGTVDETPGLRTVGGTSCLISSEGGRVFADEAIHMVDGRPVFCTEKGTLLQNGEWHGFRFDANGRYTSGDAELDGFIDGMIQKQTTAGMTQLEKLYACNCVIREYLYLGRNEAYDSSVKTMPYGDAVEFAKKIFETGKGDCYNYAAAYFFCAKRLGLDASAVIGRCAYVRWGTVPYPHAWLEIPIDGKTYIFDAQIESNNIRNGVSNEEYGVFQSTYETAPASYTRN